MTTYIQSGKKYGIVIQTHEATDHVDIGSAFVWKARITIINIVNGKPNFPSVNGYVFLFSIVKYLHCVVLDLVNNPGVDGPVFILHGNKSTSSHEQLLFMDIRERRSEILFGGKV